jgi:hypothetical protein
MNCCRGIGSRQKLSRSEACAAARRLRVSVRVSHICSVRTGERYWVPSRIGGSSVRARYFEHKARRAWWATHLEAWRRSGVTRSAARTCAKRAGRRYPNLIEHARQPRRKAGGMTCAKPKGRKTRDPHDCRLQGVAQEADRSGRSILTGALSSSDRHSSCYAHATHIAVPERRALLRDEGRDQIHLKRGSDRAWRSG